MTFGQNYNLKYVTKHDTTLSQPSIRQLVLKPIPMQCNYRCWQDSMFWNLKHLKLSQQEEGWKKQQMLWLVCYMVC